MTISMLEAALAYVEIGWAIFPIEPSTKKPYPGTRGFRDATADPDQIRRWWGVEPTAWIALALRMSGLVAVDVDVSDGKPGLATFAALEARYGPLPRDLVQESHRGGLHILMIDPSPGRDGWTRTEKEGGEVRGNFDAVGCGKACDLKCNGYILLEPSGQYRWRSFGDAPPVPDRWIEAMRKSAAELGAAPGAEGLEGWAEASDPAPLPLADRERLRSELRALGQRGRGGSTTFAAVLRTYHDYGLSLDDGWPFLTEWNANCGMPRAEAELHRQIRTIAEGGRATGRRGSRRHDISVVERMARAAVDYRAVDLDAAAAPAPSQREVEALSSGSIEETPAPAPVVPPAPSGPRLPAGAPPVEPEHPNPAFHVALEAAAQAVLDRASTPGQQRTIASIVPMFETVETLLAREYPQAPWQIQGLFTRDGTHGMSGEPKTTKSWAATESAISLVTGTRAFGKFDVPQIGRAAYFYAEDVGPSVQARIRALTAGRAGMAEGWRQRLIVQPRGRTINLLDDLDVASIIASVRMFGDLDLLVLDPLRDLHTGEEDKADAMKPVMERMRMIGDILRCSVLFVHHATKADANSSKRRPGQRMRGSSAVHGAIDCGFHMWDLRGNEQTEFIAAVSSEIKNAKSAGTFDLQLNIVDNRHGVAEKATWTVSQRAAGAAKGASGKAEPGLGDILVTLFNGGGAPMNEASIASKVKGNVGVVVALVSAAGREGFIERVMTGTTPLGWRLTDKGRNAVKAGSSAQQLAGEPAAPHPATSTICNIPEK
jgi:hypothetical protein